MKVDKKVPFYSNTSDNIHCLQASLKMIYEYFIPENIISFKKWDEITAHKSGFWTWTMSGLIWFQENGFEVVNIELFDYHKFSEYGERYLLDFFGEEVGKMQIKYSKINQEVQISKDFVKKLKLEIRLPTLYEIRLLLRNGYIVLCSINSNILDGCSGYVAHAIVIKGCTDSTLILHDPGLPPRPNLEVRDEEFYKAWAYPNDKALNISAIRLKNK